MPPPGRALLCGARPAVPTSTARPSERGSVANSQDAAGHTQID